jgi:hypothetical protein
MPITLFLFIYMLMGVPNALSDLPALRLSPFRVGTGSYLPEPPTDPYERD